MNIEVWSPIIVAFISLVGNILQYKSSRKIVNENSELKEQIKKIRQIHSGTGDNNNAGRDIRVSR